MIGKRPSESGIVETGYIRRPFGRPLRRSLNITPELRMERNFPVHLAGSHRYGGDVSEEIPVQRTKRWL